MFLNTIRRATPLTIKQQQQRMFMSWMNNKLRDTATATVTPTASPAAVDTKETLSLVEEIASEKQRTDEEKTQLVYRLYAEYHVPLAQSELRPWGAPYNSTEGLDKLDLAVSKVPKDGIDRLADGIMKTLRVLVHWFFRDRYVHHSVVLETVAAVPGMVAGMLRHFRSLRGMKRDHGRIGQLLEEAENERMHLLTWMQVCQPTVLERMLVIAAQFGFTTLYTALYIVAPRLAHRMVGYLEEEAFNSYTLFLNAIDNGDIPNRPAPEIALRYWNMAPDSTMRDVVLLVRADEACHRDFNHDMADKLKHGLH